MSLLLIRLWFTRFLKLSKKVISYMVSSSAHLASKLLNLNMSNIQTKQHIRIFSVERDTARVFFAALVEIHDGQPVIISEPKIIRIIAKHNPALPGPGSSRPFILP